MKVVLTGEGADEIFAGYSNYAKRLKEAPLCQRLNNRFSPLPYLYSFLPSIIRKERLVKAAARPESRRYTTIPSLLDRELHSVLLSRKLYKSQGYGLEHLAEQHYFSCNSEEYLDRMLHIDQGLWLADDILTKTDRATMAHSLEARVPFLDYKLVEFAARLPAHFKIRNGNRKYLLRRLAEKYLPHDIIHRPKQGFVLPLHRWLSGELKPLLDETLSAQGLLGRNIFRRGAIEKLRREGLSFRPVNSTRLWGLMILELWFRRYAPDYRCE